MIAWFCVWSQGLISKNHFIMGMSFCTPLPKGLVTGKGLIVEG